MITVKIYLKSGSSVTIKDVTAINVFYSNGMKSYEPKDFSLIPSKEQLPYVFISPDETVSIAGSEILFIQFANI